MPDTLQRLTVDDVASIWQVDRKTVYHLLKTGKLRGMKVCGLWRVLPAAIEEYEASTTDQVKAPTAPRGGTIVSRVV